VLESGDETLLMALERESLLGDMFHAGLLGYYGQLTAFGYIAGQQQGGHHYLAAGNGSFGYEPEVSYFFGIPRSVSGGGAVMNIPM